METEMIAKTDDGWKLDKKVNIFSIAGLLLALASAIFAVNMRVQKNANDIQNHKDLVKVELTAIKAFDQSLSNSQSRDQAEIIRRLERIEDGIKDNAAALNAHMNNTMEPKR